MRWYRSIPATTVAEPSGERQPHDAVTLSEMQAARLPARSRAVPDTPKLAGGLRIHSDNCGAKAFVAADSLSVFGCPNGRDRLRDEFDADRGQHSVEVGKSAPLCRQRT